jgi:cellulose synthase/poly-beta-1,6-N-acetylglucosamine synthase-like glycosyltransferase
MIVLRSLLVFTLIWGAWILMPIIIDGTDTLIRLLVIMSRKKDKKEYKIEENELPFITILVPAHNEEKIIHRCLNSIKAQNYPHHKWKQL